MTETFKVQPGDLSSRIKELTNEGWMIISTADTSTTTTEPDAHGMSYGGREITIIASNNT